MLDLTFLTEEQIFGDGKLEIFERYGTKCAITDFAILLGGFVSLDDYTSEGYTLKNRTGWWWTKSFDWDNGVHIVDNYGYRLWNDVRLCDGGARPALPYSSIESISSYGVRGNSGIKEVEYGEYPQWVVDEIYSRELERAYNNGSLRTTGKNYTTNSGELKIPSFRARTHTEYEYNGRKYIRFVGDSNCEGEQLSDERKIESGKPYWVRVEPITWLVDERANIALLKYILFSRVQFKSIRNYGGDFENTDIKQFMDNYFSKEIVVGTNKLSTISNIKTDSTDNIDDIFNEAISRMNEINDRVKTKVLK